MPLRTLPIRVEDRFLTEADVRKLWQEIRVGEPERLVVSIEGAPVSVKSEFSKLLRRVIQAEGVDVGLIPTDWDCKDGSEQPANTCVMNWHRDTATKEALRYPGARFPHMGYNLKTRRRDAVSVNSPRRGVLIVEGLHSVAFTRQFHEGPIVAVPIEISHEIQEERRTARNVREGRWTLSTAPVRTAIQRSSLHSFYGDLSRELGRTSVFSQNTIRAYE